MSKCPYQTAEHNTNADVTQLTSRQAATILGISKSSINKHRAGACACGKPSSRTGDAGVSSSVLTGKADVSSDGGEFIAVQTTEAVSDWTHIFQRFNLDPALFSIVDDTVRCSTWQQSKGLENGTRDVVNLYSYHARFTRKVAGSLDLSELTATLRRWEAPSFTPRKSRTTPVTMFVGWADWQLGKGEGDGTKGTEQRILDSFESTEALVRNYRKRGLNVDGLLLGNMGDHTEAVTGHYTSQTYSVDLNQRDQLKLALDLNLTGIKALAPLFERVTYSACLCNHGQWQRLGGKQITDDADNSTGFLGDTLHTICDLHPALEHMDWLIPRDEMITTGTFSGVNVAMAHGHKINGPEETWLAKQTAYLHATRDFRTQLWLTAHRHTASLEDFGPYHRIQCTTNDPGSKSFTDGTGKFSTPGTTTCLIGRHDPRLFSNYEVI